jgi:acyl carrier protein
MTANECAMLNRREPSFERLCAIIREECGLEKDEYIAPDTQFERDLGITGDDGEELLDAVARNYGIELTRESFGLQPNEYLFQGEGWDLFGPLIRGLLRRPEPEFRTFTVGELHAAVLDELNCETDRRESDP